MVLKIITRIKNLQIPSATLLSKVLILLANIINNNAVCLWQFNS